jgi:hypothetical protein
MAAPHGGAPPAPVAVLAQQFCAPYMVTLTITKKALSLSDGDFTVTDANGGVVLRVKGAIFSVRHRRVLVDAAGRPILTMAEKVPNTLWIGCPFLQFFLTLFYWDLVCLVSFARARSDLERWISGFKRQSLIVNYLRKKKETCPEVRFNSVGLSIPWLQKDPRR